MSQNDSSAWRTAFISIGGVGSLACLFFWQGTIVTAAVLGSLLAFYSAQYLSAVFRVAWVLQKVPAAPGGDRPFGHIKRLWNSTAWEVLTEWALKNPPLVKVNLVTRKMLLVGTAQGMKEVYQTKFRSFHKDLDFAFLPYLPILGTGLVTAHGDHWQKQRLLMAPTLRVDILGAVIRLTHQAVERLTEKLLAAKLSQRPIEMEEEFRLMTLQIIGGAVLSLTPSECDEVCWPSAILCAIYTLSICFMSITADVHPKIMIAEDHGNQAQAARRANLLLLEAYTALLPL